MRKRTPIKSPYKKLLAVLCGLMLIQHYLSAQICTSGDVLIQRQQDIDNFSATYLPGCTEIGGSLIIRNFFFQPSRPYY